MLRVLRQQFDKTWKPWRWTLALAAILAAVLGSSHLLEFRELNGEINALNQEINTIFKRTFPGSKSNRPRAVMAAQLRQLGEGGDVSTGFIDVVSTISSAVSSVPGARMHQSRHGTSGSARSGSIKK